MKRNHSPKNNAIGEISQEKIMKTENILLFPTLVTLGKREVDELEKESWFSAYLEQSNKDGVSNFLFEYSYIQDYLKVRSEYIVSLLQKRFYYIEINIQPFFLFFMIEFFYIRGQKLVINAK